MARHAPSFPVAKVSGAELAQAMRNLSDDALRSLLARPRLSRDTAQAARAERQRRSEAAHSNLSHALLGVMTHA